jgi:hypothetical protein
MKLITCNFYKQITSNVRPSNWAMHAPGHGVVEAHVIIVSMQLINNKGIREELELL